MSQEVTFVEDLVSQIFEKRKEKDKASDVVSGINKELGVLETKAIEVLKELDLKDYRAKVGTITLKEKWSIKVPKTPEEKKLLFGYLTDNELFDTYATVPSVSINALFMDLWEQAKQEGRGAEFKIPGIEQPTMYEKLGVRKR
jgi:hypothetical protein